MSESDGRCEETLVVGYLEVECVKAAGGHVEHVGLIDGSTTAEARWFA